MPERIRALLFILIFASIVFVFAQRLASDINVPDDFKRRRNLWFIITIVAFGVGNFWIYAFATAIVLIFTSSREPNPAAAFLLLLFALPNVLAAVPGFGLINYLFELNHIRLLALLILLPAFFSLSGRGDVLRFGRTGADRLLLGYMLLQFVLSFREANLTSSMRTGFYIFIDIFIPFYVFSRSLQDSAKFRDAAFSLVAALLILCLVGIFEYLRKWLPYESLVATMGTSQSFANYLSRQGNLRAVGSTGQAIVLGYVMAIGIGFFLYLQDRVRRRALRWVCAALLGLGLFVPLSRGPWVGAVATTIIFIATGRFAFRRLATLAFAALMAIPILPLVPGGEAIINLLPIVGKEDKGSVDYRANLLDNSTIVIKRNLWFGSKDYLETPEMQAMRQGQGIIDIVNTYLQVSLYSGLVGLGLFVGFFGWVLLGIFTAQRRLRGDDATEEMRRLGRALFATLSGILIIIFSLSSISVVPVLYWSIAGMGVAYAHMVREQQVRRLKSANRKLTQ